MLERRNARSVIRGETFILRVKGLFWFHVPEDRYSIVYFN